MTLLRWWSIAALMLVALAAGLVPADRATRIDPMYALKYETSFVGIVGLFPT